MKKQRFQVYQRFRLYGQDGGPYNKRSVQKIITKACQKAGIEKTATIHSLRHIQELLGHESSKTTEIYTHMTSKGLDNFRSPLNDFET